MPEKGIHTLIEAYQSLQTDKKLVITGSTLDTDEYVKQLYAMAENNPSILFTGFQDGVVADELYSNAFVYVLPSTLEGMPLTLLEAMNLGCCCITSDIAECMDVTDGSGLSFPKGNAEALRDVLQDLCDHPEKAEVFRHRARRVISEKHTWSEITARTHELCSTLL